MSTFYNEARGKWMYGFSRQKKRYQAYCVDENGHDVTTKRAADACEARVKLEVEKALKSGAPGIRVPGAYTVEQMFADYAVQHAGKQRSWRKNIRGHIAELMEFYGRQTPASSIDVNEIERFVIHSRQQAREVYMGGPKRGGESVKTTKTRADSTTDKYLNTLRAAINWAADRGKMSPVKVRRLDSGSELPNPVSLALVNAILAVAPPHLALAIKLAVHTGMRLDETLSVRWDQIDFDQMAIVLPARSVKAKTGQVVHINADLASDLRAAPRLADTVIAYTRATTDAAMSKRPAAPVKSLRRSWQTAQKAVGITKFYRFHDLRATFCTAVLKANNNPLALKKAARHASLTTTMRYAEVADQMVKSAFDATAGLLNPLTPPTNKVVGTETSTIDTPKKT